MGEEIPAGIDDPDVTRWYAEHVPGAEAPLTFHRVAGGHSCLTYIVTDAAGTRTVLRRPPLGQVLASAHDVAREHRIMKALEGTGVPLPRMLGVSPGPDVNGAPFYVMTCVDGVVLHSAEDTEALLPSLAARQRAAETLVDALVALQAVDLDAVGLADLARRGGYVDRQLKRWATQWEASKTREVPAMEQLHEWLVANRPAEQPDVVVHGDFRLGNVIHAPDGTVVAVLDWELCTLGDPMADISYLLRSWVQPGEVPPNTLAAASAAEGFPTRDDLAARYAVASGRSLDDLGYWTAFHAWRSAAIVQGVYRRYIDGKMGDLPEDVDRYARSVDAGAEAGLVAAGLA